MARSEYLNDQSIGLSYFLKDYPEMQVVPSRTKSLVVRGTFSFIGKTEQGPELADSFELEIIIPDRFPFFLPKVKEIAKKIPRAEGFHINPDDSLCLGSPLRLLSLIKNEPTLVGFAERCLVPYLYAISLKLKEGGKLYMGELEHGAPGIIADYLNLFNLKNKNQVIYALKLICLRKRVANKKLCPCDCGKRLGKCLFRFNVNKFRNTTTRKWLSAHLKELC